ncbi:MAG: AsmA-like C-terminal region-containing protein [Dichotomicrobium sp.]
MSDAYRQGRFRRAIDACKDMAAPAGRQLARYDAKMRALALRVPEPTRMRVGRACKRCGRLSLEICTGLIVVGVVALVLVYGRLSQGPISMAFLVEPAEQSVNGQLRGPSIDIGDAVVRLSDSGGIEFRLKTVRLYDRSGVVVAEAPFASVGLSARALLTGRLAAGSVELIGPRVLLQINENDNIALSVDARSQDTLPQPIPVPAAPDAGQQAQPDKRAIPLAPAVNKLFDGLGVGEDGGSYLTTFGLRDAEFFLARAESVTRWQIRQFEVDLERSGGQSMLLGRASVGDDARAWDMTFEIAQNDGDDRLSLGLRVDNLVPRDLGTEFAMLSPLRSLDVPVTASVSAEMAADGWIRAASGEFELGSGRIFAPWNENEPAAIDSGTVQFTYSDEAGRFELEPSTLRWGQSRMTLVGAVEAGPRPEGAAADSPRDWTYRFATTDIALAAEQFGLPAIPIDGVTAQGRLIDGGGRIELERLRVQAADAFVDLKGEIADAPGSPAVRMAGQISPMPVAFLKLIWPKFVAPGAREWIGESVSAGQITGGEIDVDIPGGVLAELEEDGDLPSESVKVRFGTDDLEMSYIKGMPKIRTEEGTVMLLGRRFVFNVPRSIIPVPGNKAVELVNGQFVIPDLRQHLPDAELNFRIASSAGAGYALLNHDPLNYAGAVGFEPKALKGDLEGAFGLEFPLLEDLDFEDIGIRGRATLENPEATGIAGDFSVTGGELVFDVNDKALNANGDLMVEGIPVNVDWHRIFGAPDALQPGLRLSANLDSQDREKLGLDVNHVLRGAVPLNLSIAQREGNRQVRLEADLTNAEVFFINVASRKPPGENAVLSFDIAEDDEKRTVLENVRMVGDDIAITGSVTMGKDGLPRAFEFPTFSPNLLTRMQVSGIRDAQNVWRVEATGDSYDGREFFRSLFSKGKLAEDQPERPERDWGMDIKAKIGTVRGYNNTSISNLTAHIRKDSGELTKLSMNGRLAGKAPLAVRLRKESGEPRYLLAEATDAGAAFRLVGLYSRMAGGEMSLRVNLDGLGEADRIGTLYAWDFKVLGDEVVDQVLFGDGTGIGAVSKQQRRLPRKRRTQIDFNTMRIPFSVGNGQFILRDAVINGPLLGATMRGRLDLKRDRVKLSGTYVPLYGLNAAISSVPIIGDLLTGRSGEGIFGMTFAVRGDIDNPEVLVNPVSAVAPGFLRQIFEFDQSPPRISPEERQSSNARSGTSGSPSLTR